VAAPIEITLLTKPGCHLCDDARRVVEQVQADCATRGVATTLAEHNILNDAELARRHSEDIPIVYVAGRRHAIWRVDAEKLTRAIERAGKPRLFGRAR